MNPFGIMILVQPAVLCLVLGTALIMTGIIWLFYLRHIQTTRLKWIIAASVFVITFIAFTILTWAQYDMPPMHFELIRGLD